MPNWEITSGGVKIAENKRIAITKYFLFSFKRLIVINFSLTRIINKIGNKKEIPHEKSKYIVSFIYSEYLDSSSKEKESPRKFSNDRKKDQISGIKKKYENKTPKKKRIGTKDKIGKKKFFSFLYKAGEINIDNWSTKNGNETRKDEKIEIFKLEINTSGSPVKIILLFEESSKR